MNHNEPPKSTHTAPEAGSCRSTAECLGQIARNRIAISRLQPALRQPSACPISDRHDRCSCAIMESHRSLAARFCFAERAAFIISMSWCHNPVIDHPSSRLLPGDPAAFLIATPLCSLEIENEMRFAILPQIRSVSS